MKKLCNNANKQAWGNNIFLKTGGFRDRKLTHIYAQCGVAAEREAFSCGKELSGGIKQKDKGAQLHDGYAKNCSVMCPGN